MRIDDRQHLLAVLAIGAVTLLAADRFALTPLVKLWKTRSDRVAQLRQQVAQGQVLVRREQEIRRRWDRMRTNALPNNPPLAEQQVLKALDAWAQQNRVSITSLMPQWKHETDEYQTLDCRVETAGDLESLTRFLYDLERDPRALRLDSVELTARDDAGQQLTLGLQISGLVLTPPNP